MDSQEILPKTNAEIEANDTNWTTDGEASNLTKSSKLHSRLPSLRKGKNRTVDEDWDDGYANDDEYEDLLSEVPVIEDRWTPQPSWSIAPGPHESKTDKDPLLTSTECYLGLVDFFQRKPLLSTQNSNMHLNFNLNSTQWLSVATESSSHVSDLYALDAQPWVYAGGGLGNVDECLYLNTYFPKENPLVHVCLAGGTSRDSLTFASACVPAGCSAKDVFADDFVERVETAGFRATPKHDKRLPTEKYDTADFSDLLKEYIGLHKRIAKVGDYLGTGWVCGEYVVDWEPIPLGLWCAAMLVCAALTILRTCFWNTKGQSYFWKAETNQIQQQYSDMEEVPRDDSCTDDSERSSSTSSSPSSCGSKSSLRIHVEHTEPPSAFWSAWDASAHLRRLRHRHTTTTASLDGIKVGSILWIIAAHIMAIQSSTGAGYLNPGSFLPPHGFTTTAWGQLLFSSRYAVDTFLCVSGYLAAYVLQRKLASMNKVGGLQIVGICLVRILRILPLYVCCLGFWMFLAPHLGHGPFWYQWEHFLEPCKQLWWTNLLFVNNFWPWGAPTEANCFYHSWYLAVDVQLFCLFAPWLVICYKKCPKLAQKITILLWFASVVGTACLAYTQGWSVNSIDGISVALFDVEGYAKPHVRAQSYLAGIFVAFLPRLSSGHKRWKSIGMILVLLGLALLSFVTVTGAYGRRACTFEESPLEGDDCGSLWSPAATFVYTAFSRAAWSLCIGLLLHLCLGDNNEHQTCSIVTMVRDLLGWSAWTPLAHLSFGAYLIHPIVIYVWFLGGREKIFFRLSTFFMEFCSITVVTFALSFVVTILVEFPFGILLRPPSRTPKEHPFQSNTTELASLLVVSQPSTYGSVKL